MSQRMIPLHIADQAVAAVEAELLKFQTAHAFVQAENVRLKADLEKSDGVVWTQVVENERLKAALAKSEEHNDALCERMQDLNGEVHTASCTNARLNSLIANSEQENARLKAEVERLTKAGDAMEKWIRLTSEQTITGHLPKSIKRWNAAKESKQS